MAEILDVGALFGCRLLGQIAIVLGDVGKLQVLEMTLQFLSGDGQGEWGFCHDESLLVRVVI
jgi:hypothetical protein